MIRFKILAYYRVRSAFESNQRLALKQDLKVRNRFGYNKPELEITVVVY